MKKIVKIIMLLIIILFPLNMVQAKEVEVKLKNVISKNLIDSDNDGKQNYVVQGMTITDKYIVVGYNHVAPAEEKDKKSNYFCYWDKKNYEFKKCQLLSENKSKNYNICGHAGTLTYNSKNNEIVCSAAGYFVVYQLDKNGYISPGGTITKYSTEDKFYGINYDRKNDIYYAVQAGDKEGIVKFTEKNHKLEKKSEITNIESFNLKDNKKYRINQTTEYYDGYLYLLNWITATKDNQGTNVNTYQPSVKTKLNEYDMIIYSYNIKDGKIAKKGNIIINHYSKSSRKQEPEGVAVDNGKFYFSFQRGGKLNIQVLDSKKINLVVNEKNNNKTSFNNLNTKATFKSATNNLSLNKTVNYSTSSNIYKLSNVELNNKGAYKINVSQNPISSKTWKLDTSTLVYSVNIVNDIQTQKCSILPCALNESWKSGDNTFNNSFSYETITVPIEVKGNVSKPNDYTGNLSLTATLYKAENNKSNKVDTINLNNSTYKYTKLKFSSPGTYTYELKQNNSGTKKEGIYTKIIDNSTITITIKVTADTDKLTSKVTYKKKSFTNKIDVSYNTVKNDYSISINTQKPSNVNVPKTEMQIYKGTSKINTIASNNNAYAFSISISKPGTYNYTLKQDTSNVGTGIYGYSLDGKEIKLSIEATVKDNKLVCTSTLNSKKFSNQVSINYGEIRVPLKININTVKPNSISVPITKAKITGNNVNEEINSSGNTYNYTAVISKEGTYTYTIKQKNMTFQDLYYNMDSTSITATVVVTSNGNTLQSRVTYSKSEFNNVFEDDTDPISLKVSATIQTTKNDSSISTPVTTAYLYNENNNLIDTKNSNNGGYTFNSIVLNSVGTYHYTIQQNTSQNSGNSHIAYQIDDSIIHITIVVTQSNGTLKASTTYDKRQFNNTVIISYDSIIVKPTYNIDNDIKSGATKNTELSAKMYDSNNNVVSQAQESNNKYVFSVTITKAGTYKYKIKQNNTGINKVGGISSIVDDDVKVCIITVTSNNGVLTANIDYQDNDKKFENQFVKTNQVLHIPVEIEQNTRKINPNAPDPILEATISEINDEGNREVIEKVNNTGNKYIFTSIDIIEPGTYYYEINQVNSGNRKDGIKKYYISDDTIIIKIIVRRDNSSSLTYEIEGDDESFENTIDIEYEPIPISLSVSVPSSINNVKKEIVFADDKEVLDDIISTSNTITSNKIKVSKAGTYTYYIFQRTPYNYIEDGINYQLDEKIITATVLVSESNNQLNYDVSYNSTPAFNNNYSSSTNDSNTLLVPIDIDIFSNDDSVNTLPTKATLYLNNQAIETVDNEDGKYHFTKLKVSEIGNYRYTIKQTTLNKNGWDIDDNEISVEVEVFEDENYDNRLGYELQFVDNTTSFTNINISARNSADDSNNNSFLIPDTAAFKDSIHIIIGIILIGLGIAFIIKKEPVK